MISDSSGKELMLSTASKRSQATHFLTGAGEGNEKRDLQDGWLSRGGTLVQIHR